MKPRLSRDILVYGVGEVVVKAFGLVTLPIYTRIFSPDEYGVLSLVLTVAGFVLAIVALGGDSAYIRYFMAARTLAERQTVTSTWIGFLAVWSTLAIVVMLPFASQLSDVAVGDGAAAGAFAIALLWTPVRLINMMCGQLLRNEFRAGAFIVLNVTSLGLTVAFSVAAATLLQLGIFGVLVGTLAAELTMLPIRLYSASHMLRWRFSYSALRRLLVYGVPLVPTSLAYWVFTTSDRLLISNMSTLEEVGLYSVAVSAAGVANIAVMALGQGWNPHALHAYESDPATARLLFRRMFTYILAGFGLLATAIAVFAQELIGLLAGSGFEGAAAAMPPLALGVIAYASTQITAGGISFKARTIYLALHSWTAAIINIVLNLFLIPPFGMVGAAWATAAAYVFLTIAYGITSHRLWPFEYDTRRAVVIVVLSVCAVLGSPLLPVPDAVDVVSSVAGLALKALYCLSLLAAMFILGGLDRAELGRLRLAARGIRRSRAAR